MSEVNVVIYLVRHDMRVKDNPILDRLASSKDHGFTHLLPLHVIPPYQMEVSGFLKNGTKSPYPEARSEVGRFWRCGPHRARFIAQSLWNLKDNYIKLGNDLNIRIGKSHELLKDLINGLKEQQIRVSAVWMIAEEGYEEEQEEKNLKEACSALGIQLEMCVDEKYFIDDRDLKLATPQDLPDVFTSYRKMNEPLRERPRPTKSRPSGGSLPKPVEASLIPAQPDPFEIPTSLEALEAAFLRPIERDLPAVIRVDEMKSAHPFRGGEDNALDRLQYLINSGSASSYKSSRNGLLGVDYSTKLSAYLAQGCISARQVHEELLHYEDGADDKYENTDGYGQGENEGTQAIRFELLWRDYMRLCTRKFRAKLFHRSGFRNEHSQKWKTARTDDKSAEEQSQSTDDVAATVHRILEGTTGQSLIDASQRELIHTGYTSNRARQNVGSFLAKHLNIDWRYGAEWYEFMLVDYDVNSNWSNWQYVAGVGNDPRGDARIFNPVKQAFDYDKDGEYVRCWVPEIRKVEKLENLFQPWTTPKEDWERFGLNGLAMAENPVKRINFSVEGKPKSSRRPYVRKRGQGRGEMNNSTTSKSTPSDNGIEEKPPTAQGPHGARNSTANYRGGPRGGARGMGGGGRGRGYGGPRRGFHGGRGGFQQSYTQVHGAIPPHPWSQSHIGPA
ncbi:cryptochrome [Xylaria bambusicola]|uniref:cryptochrome n=1 Tax=Xylaria bambusicola TaxID=326684 RepID=UPI0020089AC6|nr:cryptochrome [Xylaria bambusicola]KAI0522278.1 cryptochrome [Xylaria bambusicola]